jgi:Fur family ferric uptake transcriptional regulator
VTPSPFAVPGIRTTRQRSAVVEALSHADGFRTAQQLHERLRADGVTVGLTTVYRTLQALVDAEQVDMVRADDGEALYRLCAGQHHHHHLVCRGCGRTVEVEGPAVEEWAREVGVRHGYRDIDHVVEIFGTCSTCAGNSGQEGS